MKGSLNIAGVEYSIALTPCGNEVEFLKIDSGETFHMRYALEGSHERLEVQDSRISKAGVSLKDAESAWHFDIECSIVRERAVLNIVSSDRNIQMFQIML